MEIYEFAAWALDFEGCISIGSHTNSARKTTAYQSAVRVNNTSLKLLYAFQARIGFGTTSPNTNISAEFSDIFVWSLSQDEIRFHLPKILPFLILKQEQARLVLRLCELKQVARPRGRGQSLSQRETAEREALYQACRVLNERKPTKRSAEEEMLRLLRRR